MRIKMVGNLGRDYPVQWKDGETHTEADVPANVDAAELFERIVSKGWGVRVEEPPATKAAASPAKPPPASHVQPPAPLMTDADKAALAELEAEEAKQKAAKAKAK